MDHFSRLIAWSLLALVSSAVANAQTMCTMYKGSSGGVEGAYALTQIQALESLAAACGASQANAIACAIPSDCPSGVVSCENWAAGAVSPTPQVTYTRRVISSGATAQRTRNVNIGSASQPCPPPEECSNDPADGVGDVFTSLHFPGADGYCNPISKCRMAVTSSVAVDGSTIYTIEHTAQQCTHVQQPGPGPTDLTDGENCVSGSGGEFCLSNEGENCGFVNDGFVCLPQIEQDGCEVFSDGGRVCGPQAPMPPVPDSGTPGQPAPPDEQIVLNQNNTTTTYNYFNSNTVANSARPAGTSGDNPYDGEDDGNGGGSCEGEECGEGQGEASGGETCAAPPSCSGDPIQCAQLKQQWQARCPDALTQADIESALGPSEAIPSEEVQLPADFSQSVVTLGAGSSCPQVPPISLPLGGTVDLEPIFDAFCELAGMLAPMVMLGAYLSAAFIVFGIQREG